MMAEQDCALLFSGGTDSTCAAALCAERFRKVHLLTFYEEATKASPLPVENFRRLQGKYGEEKFSLVVISTDRLVQKLSYENYFRRLFRFGLYLIATPGFSSLSWHVRAVRYCQDHGISHVFDGMTRELTHLPGHVPAIRDLFRDFYLEFGITFESPVYSWPVPDEQSLSDRLVVDQHGFSLVPRPPTNARTTGTWLFEQGLLPRPNVKGSLFDQRMQHDCYPFVVYNMLVFWILVPVFGWNRFFETLLALFRAKIAVARQLLLDPRATDWIEKEGSPFAR